MFKEELIQIDFSNPVNQVLFTIMVIMLLVVSVMGIILFVKYSKRAKEISENKLIPYLDEEKLERREK